MFHANHKYDSDNLVDLKTYDYQIATSYLFSSDTFHRGIYNPNNTYSVVGLKLKLTSKWFKYLTLYYIPTVLIVVTSYILSGQNFSANNCISSSDQHLLKCCS